MDTKSIGNLVIYFQPEENETAAIVEDACRRSIQLIQEKWGLEIPQDCRVYVMTSWSQFLFHSAPWHWKLLLAITFPIWMVRVRRLWEFAGGWMQRFGKRCAVGVKPAWLLELADRSIGKRIFIQEDSLEQRVQFTTCHELTHAFTAHLKLPMWLNEGLAMVMVDKFMGKPTVQLETLQSLKHSEDDPSPRQYHKVSTKDSDSLVYHTVRGYWITRHLEKTRPDLLKEILNHRYSHKELESRLAASFGMNVDEFWQKIDKLLVDGNTSN